MLFGAYLCVHFLHLAPWAAEVYSNRGALPDAADSPFALLFPNILAWFDPPWFVTGVALVAAAASVLLAVGRFDRVAAILIWYVLACQFGRNPLTLNPSLPFVGLLLIVHAMLPAAPYGSLGARGRPDPGGGWRLPAPLFVAVWIVMAIGYTYSGCTKLISPSWLDGTAMAHVLENPLARPTMLRAWLLDLPDWMLKVATWTGLGLELAFAPLALFRRTRPWIWLLLLGMHVDLLILIDFADLSLGMVMLHVFTFDPSWLPARGGEKDQVYYDGHCGLCHRTVRFVLAEDPAGAVFVFSPLQSEAFERSVPEDERARLPDSIVVRTADGRLLTQSVAIAHMLDRLGGMWRIAAHLMRIVPRPVRDVIYRGIAAVRRKVFATPDGVCPMLPPEIRERFVM